MFSRKGALPVDKINVLNCSDKLQLSYSEELFLSEHAEHRKPKLKNISEAQTKLTKQQNKKRHKPRSFQVGCNVTRFSQKEVTPQQVGLQIGWSLQYSQIEL